MATTSVDYVQSTTNIGALIHEVFKGKVKPWLDVMDPVAALHSKVGDGGYTMVGEKLVFAAEARYAGMAMATGGYLPGSQYVDVVNLETTPARTYVRRAVDNFVVARGSGEGTFEDFMSRIMKQMWEAFERMTIRHIHGSSAATVCLASSRTSSTVVVVKDGLGYTGQAPCAFIEPGMWLCWHDVSNANAVAGVGVVSSITYNTSATTATITFAAAFDDGVTTITGGDILAFCTSNTSTDNWFQSERTRAPLGLMDNVDASASNSSYLTVTEATYPRVKPVRRASADWGEIEFMEFVAEIEAKSNSQVTPSTHTATCQQGVLLELAKTLVPFTTIMNKGKSLEGGWETVSVAGHDFVTSSYHLWDVLYLLCMEDLKVVDLDGEEAIWAGDGNQFRRLADYDGKEWFAKHYLQRFADRRNRCGALTGVTNPNKERYSAHPVS